LSKLTETAYLRNLRSYSSGKTYVNLVGLLECRLDTLKDKLLTADDSEYKSIQGQAKEIKHLLNSLTREAVKEQFTGSFN
jgi:hypothetical protein